MPRVRGTENSELFDKRWPCKAGKCSQYRRYWAGATDSSYIVVFPQKGGQKERNHSRRKAGLLFLVRSKLLGPRLLSRVINSMHQCTSCITVPIVTARSGVSARSASFLAPSCISLPVQKDSITIFSTASRLFLLVSWNWVVLCNLEYSRATQDSGSRPARWLARRYYQNWSDLKTTGYYYALLCITVGFSKYQGHFSVIGTP